MSLLHQLNEEQVIFDDVMYHNKVYPNETIHVLLKGATGTKKVLDLKLIVQGILQYL